MEVRRTVPVAFGVDSEDFDCLTCGYENHADYNVVAGVRPAGSKVAYEFATAKNIGLWDLRRTQPGGDAGTPLGVRLNGGTLNVNGSYSPGSDEARTGIHAESHRFSGE